MTPSPERAPAPPLPPRFFGPCEVLRQEDLGRDQRVLTVRAPALVAALPGQFAMVGVVPVGAAERDPILPRPLAIYRAREDHADFFYRIVGRGTHRLADVRPGDRLAILGPLGRPFDPPAAGGEAIVVAGGVGIASVYLLAEALRERHPVRLLYGGRTAGDLACAPHFEALGVRVELATDDGSRGVHGLVTALLERALAEPRAVSPTVYACGPTPMMAAVARLVGDHRCQVSVEARMACGIATCRGCAVPLADGRLALACTDGPVFEGREVFP